MTEHIKLNILLSLLLQHIDTSDLLHTLLGLVLVAEMPDGTKQQLVEGLSEMIGKVEP